MTTTENSLQVGHEEIARLSKEIWEREGRQTGRDVEYWLRAEGELRSAANRPGAARTQQATAATALLPEPGRGAKGAAASARSPRK
jgi:hypothetical protein